MCTLSLIAKILDYAPKVFNAIRPWLSKKEKPENPLSYKDVEHIQSQIKSATTKGNK